MNHKIIYLYSILSFLIAGKSAYAQKLTPRQQAKFDSLQSLLKKDIADTSKVRAFIGLCQVYFHAGEKEAVEYNNQAFELSTKINYQRGLVWSTHNKGTFLIAQGKYSEAKEFLNKALQLAEGKYKVESIPILYDLGVVNRRDGNQSKGLDYYLEALKVLETVQLQTKESSVQYCNITQAIGVVYFEQDDHDKAISFFEKSSNKCKEINYQLGLSYNFNGLGGVYRKKKNYPKAMEYLQKSLEIANKNHYERLRADLLSDIGEIYHIQNQADSSLSYYQQSKKISEALTDSVGIANSMLGIANAYTLQGNLGEAQKTASKGLEIAVKLNNLQNIKDAYKALADIYEAKKQPQEALNFYKKAQELEDTLYNAEKHKQILQVQNQYENYKKEQQVLQQKYEIENLKKQNKIGVLFTVLLIVALVSTILVSYLFIKQKQLKAKKDKALLELEQAMLKEEQMQTQLELIN
nr:tetratricopeptide repeat protein [Raineya sp.]